MWGTSNVTYLPDRSATHSGLPQRAGTPLMKDGEHFDDVVFVDETDCEREPPRQNTASVQLEKEFDA